MNQVFNNIKEYLYNINKTENNNELSLSDKIQMLSHLNSNKNHLSSKINLMCQNTINTGTLYRNLEMFTDNLGTTEQTIFNKINNTKTLFGESSLKNILSKTTTDISLLSERQHNIKKFLNSTENTQLISQQLNTIKGNENEILWHWENISDHIRELKTCIETCKHVENSIETIEIQQKESCPICLEVIKSIDYFVPMCGHKICRCCAMSNLFNNKHTGTLCSLCREKIF